MLRAASSGCASTEACLRSVEHHVLVDLIGRAPACRCRRAPPRAHRGRARSAAVQAGLCGTVEQHQPGARAEHRVQPLPVVAKSRLGERQTHAASAGEPHRRLVGVVGRIEDDDLVARPDQRLHGRVDRLGRPERDGDFGLRVDRDAVGGVQLRRDALAQRRQTLHRCVLVVAGAHGRGHQLGEPRIDVVIGKALAEIERVELAGAARHDGEDRRADVGQLARHRARPARSAASRPPPARRRPRRPDRRSAPGAAAPASATAARTRAKRSLTAPPRMNTSGQNSACSRARYSLTRAIQAGKSRPSTVRTCAEAHFSASMPRSSSGRARCWERACRRRTVPCRCRCRTSP